MKKVFIVLVILVMILGVVGCSETSVKESEKATQSADEAPKQTEETAVTISEAKELAEKEGLSKLLWWLNQSSEFKKYNINATEYSIGTIDAKPSGSDYTCMVYGKLFFYDNYGDLSDTATFEVKVDVDRDGSTHGYMPDIDIE